VLPYSAPAVLPDQVLVVERTVTTQAVYFQGRVGPAAFAAVPAQERRLLGVRPVLQFQGRGKAEGLWAFEGAVVRVNYLVPDQSLQAALAVFIDPHVNSC
jgi:hypothetical protein